MTECLHAFYFTALLHKCHTGKNEQTPSTTTFRWIFQLRSLEVGREWAQGRGDKVQVMSLLWVLVIICRSNPLIYMCIVVIRRFSSLGPSRPKPRSHHITVIGMIVKNKFPRNLLKTKHMDKLVESASIALNAQSFVEVILLFISVYE